MVKESFYPIQTFSHNLLYLPTKIQMATGKLFHNFHVMIQWHQKNLKHIHRESNIKQPFSIAMFETVY